MNKQETNAFTVMICVLIVCALAFIALTGCAMAVPYAECLTMECETKAIKREDHQFRRDQQELKRLSCTVPFIWDGRSRKCMLPSMIL